MVEKIFRWQPVTTYYIIMENESNWRSISDEQNEREKNIAAVTNIQV